MAASVKIEFDDGSRVISQKLEVNKEQETLTLRERRPASCPIDIFYEIPKTTEFISNGNFRRIALQFPDSLLREAPEVLWTLQARLRKKRGAEVVAGGASAATGELLGDEGDKEPLIFVTGDTSYGSCCVDEVSAQHLKADAIVHYGRACLSPTNSSVPVLYVFGRGIINVDDLAETLLAGPLRTPPPLPQPLSSSSSTKSPVSPTTDERSTTTINTTRAIDSVAPVLLLYDVTYAHAIPDLMETLGKDLVRDGKLVVGFPTPQAYSPLGKAGDGGDDRVSTKEGKCGDGECKTSGSATVSADTAAANSSPSTHGTGAETMRRELGDVGAITTETPTCVASAITTTSSSCAVATTCCKSTRDGEADCSSRTMLESRSSGDEVGADADCDLERSRCCGGGSAREAGVTQPVSTTAKAQGGEVLPLSTSLPTVDGQHEQAVESGTVSTVAVTTVLTAAVDARTSVAETITAAMSSMSVSAASVPSCSTSQQKKQHKRTIRIGGLGVDVASEEELKRYTMVFVGGEGRQLSNVLLRCAGCRDRVRYDPVLPAGQRLVADTGRGNKDLMRRYYLVQRAKEAGVVGIVVGTLGVQHYGTVVRALRKMIEDAGRKAYTLAVGKVNVAKLANFAEVDVFCLVACAENSLLDSKEFHAPVVTPLELEVALGKREWDGFYSTDFDDISGLTAAIPSDDKNTKNCSENIIGESTMAQRNSSGATSDVDAEDDDSSDQPFFSLVTGTFKNVPGRRAGRGVGGGALLRGGGDAGGEGALVELGDRSLVEWSSPAADFLNQREYQGLEALVGQTEARPATEGQSGIASDYGGV